MYGGTEGGLYSGSSEGVAGAAGVGDGVRSGGGAEREGPEEEVCPYR